MDSNYIILTDSNSELPLEIAKKAAIPFVHMPYTLDGVEYAYDLGEHTDFPAFFQKMRNGLVPTTSTYPPQFYYDFIKPYLDEGKDVLFVSFSSKLSKAYEFLSAGIDMLKEEYPDKHIEAVDSKSISGGLAILMIGVLELYDSGASMDECISWLDENIPKTNQWFTVDDLNHLKRGGRLPAATAVVGTMLKIKPIININDEGSIVPCEKVTGRKKSIKRLARLTIEKAVDPENSSCVILHADCIEEANTMKELIEKEINFKQIYVQYIGPVIGTHAGPNTLGVCFLGNNR